MESKKMAILKLIQGGEAVEEQASAWLARLDSIDVNDTDWDDFSAWLAEDPSHQKVYEDMRADWKRFAQLADLDSDEKLGIEQSLMVDEVKTSGSRMGLYRKMVAVAATVLISFGVFQNFDQIYVPENTYQTEVGAKRTIELADGSSITLNTDSRVKVNYDGETRGITLIEGEAYFDVAHDATRPFIVEVGDKQVRAVGTAFNIRRQNKEFSVLVTDGTVEVSEAANEIMPDRLAMIPVDNSNLVYVTKGQKIKIKDKVARAEKIVAPVPDKELSWQKGELEFDGETLEEVLRQFSRYTDKKIILVGDDIKTMKVGGVFEAGNVDALVSALNLMLPVKVMKVTPYVTFLVHDDQLPNKKS